MTERYVMSERAKQELEKRMKEVRDDLAASTLSLGAAGEGSDWHDNFALDQAHRDVDLKSATLRALEEKLRNPEIIPPRKETDEVGIGNTIIIRYEGDEEDMRLHLLGSVDATVFDNSISAESRVGAAILGKKQGDVAEISAGDQTLRIKVVEIQPGDF